MLCRSFNVMRIYTCVMLLLLQLVYVFLESIVTAKVIEQPILSWRTCRSVRDIFVPPFDDSVEFQ